MTFAPRAANFRLSASPRAELEGTLELAAASHGIVLFAHGSGSSRHSPRNVLVAKRLYRAGFATLLMDLLTPQEDSDVEARFDIELLSERLGSAAQFVARDPRTAHLPLGLFGASTGAAAALRLAGKDTEHVKAVVSRGGRPDLAGDAALRSVTAPTLLIVGGHDVGVLELNERAYALLRGTKRLAIVPGATHLFEEPGALEAVADLAADWFSLHLRAAAPARPPA